MVGSGCNPLYRGQTEFKPPAWHLVLIIVIAAAVSAGTVFQFMTAGIDWITLTMIVFSLLGLVGVAEVLTTSVVLTESELEISRLLRKSTIARANIEEVTWAKGANVAVRQDGEWVKLPEVGRNTQALCNSIRAWVKATR